LPTPNDPSQPSARDGDDRLAENELTSLALLILRAGFEATVHLISNGIATVRSEPRLAKLVRKEADPHTSRIAVLVEELLRRDGPVFTAIRHCAWMLEYERYLSQIRRQTNRY
jgi:cytochrome P450